MDDKIVLIIIILVFFLITFPEVILYLLMPFALIGDIIIGIIKTIRGEKEKNE
ncbi:MAG: hypothetical protein PVG65_05790 [Candidatus Thorarchaeota archaeon]|jgi:hypothetical protein